MIDQKALDERYVAACKRRWEITQIFKFQNKIKLCLPPFRSSIVDFESFDGGKRSDCADFDEVGNVNFPFVGANGAFAPLTNSKQMQHDSKISIKALMLFRTAIEK